MGVTDRKFIHPNVKRWIESKVNRKMEIEYGDELNLFLQVKTGLVQ